jgi:hypothetical protein
MGAAAEIRTNHLPNKSLDRYRLTILLGKSEDTVDFNADKWFRSLCEEAVIENMTLCSICDK